MRSSRKIENSLHNLRGSLQFLGVLTVLMSFAALAQTRGGESVHATASVLTPTLLFKD